MKKSKKTSKEIFEDIENAYKQALCLRAQEIEKENDIKYCINAVVLAIISGKIRPAANKIGDQLILRNAQLLTKVPVQYQYHRVVTYKKFCWIYVSIVAKAFDCQNIESLVNAVA